MAGLEKIIDQIRAESDQAAEKLLSEAKAQAEAILTASAAEADAQCAEIEKAGARAAAGIIERGRSAAALKKRQRLLAEKQALMKETVDAAKERLKGLETGAYFNMLRKLAVKAAAPGEGVLILSAADLHRLPADFESGLSAELAKNGAGLTISKEPGAIDGGFILSYGGIEENCSIDALFDAAKEQLQDKAQELLF